MKATRVNYPVLVWQYDGTNAEEILEAIVIENKFWGKRYFEIQEFLRKSAKPKQLVIEIAENRSVRASVGDYIIFDPKERTFDVQSEDAFKLWYELGE